GQAPGERGFHVFYQLLEARDDPALQLLALRGAESYRDFLAIQSPERQFGRSGEEKNSPEISLPTARKHGA
ncbi:unnamed protein product, partial [Symbiodinium sp. CCMP2456]